MHSSILDVTVLGDTDRGHLLQLVVFLGGLMRPLMRHGANKKKGAKRFRRNVSRTKGANMAINPMRGGWRL